MVGTNEEPEYYLEDEEPQHPTHQAEAQKACLDFAGRRPRGHGPRATRPPWKSRPPVRSQKVANRNDKVSVQYMDGRIVRDVKYKTVEEDVLHNRCVLVD